MEFDKFDQFDLRLLQLGLGSDVALQAAIGLSSNGSPAEWGSIDPLQWAAALSLFRVSRSPLLLPTPNKQPTTNQRPTAPDRQLHPANTRLVL
jgi:hypothetical protein